MNGLRNYLKLLFIGIILLSATELQAGGPWLHKQKSGFLTFQAIPSAYRYTRLVNGSISDRQNINREVWNSDFVFYGEYGITDKLDIIANIPFKSISTGAATDSLYYPELLPEGSLRGLGNIKLAFKYAILDKNLKFALSLQSSFNTAVVDLSKGLATGFQANSLGLVAHLGGSINDKSFAFFEGGFHKYDNGFSDYIEAKIEYGKKLSPSFTLMADLDIRQSLNNGTYFNENLLQTGLYPNNQGGIVVSLKAAYETENGLGFSFGMPLIPIKLQHVGLTGSFAFGIYKNL